MEIGYVLVFSFTPFILEEQGLYKSIARNCHSRHQYMYFLESIVTSIKIGKSCLLIEGALIIERMHFGDSILSMDDSTKVIEALLVKNGKIKKVKPCIKNKSCRKKYLVVKNLTARYFFIFLLTI
jgi:UDP-3-O-[3-hydroxymyristoyl] glucosamine N-acyltransferase